jgi:hypothetical protein
MNLSNKATDAAIVEENPKEMYSEIISSSVTPAHPGMKRE